MFSYFSFGDILRIRVFAVIYSGIILCTPSISQTLPQNLILDEINSLEQGKWFKNVITDRARYAPGDTVRIKVEFWNQIDSKKIFIRYRHLHLLLAEQSLEISDTRVLKWSWCSPAEDFKGYLIEIFLMEGKRLLDQINIAVDVSSNWKKFPRYGFLSKFPQLNHSKIDEVLSRLNRYHLNGLQFYDWHHKHHKPLRGTPEKPASTWKDIANRTNHFSTIERYINTAHAFNMKAMAYNLLYGSWDDADSDGISEGWRIYRDANLQKPFMLDLPQDWKSDLYMLDPSNQRWKNYIFAETAKLFRALPFDGWHVDQLGDWGDIWNAKMQKVQLDKTFHTFLEDAKETLKVDLVMNAVNQYGQQEIAIAPVDFLYTEVWDPYTTYADLARIIQNNSEFSEGKLSTVLAAYMNYDLSDSNGLFNTPGILFTDAVIFAYGGAHLEVGEHMLCHEYFPNDNLVMSDKLQNWLIHYYDFLVGYQNLLRDNVRKSSVQLNTSGSLHITASPQLGKVWSFTKEKNNRQIFHLINFINVTSLEWRDNLGKQAEPEIIKNLPLWFDTTKKVEKIWIASPDFHLGSPIEIEFTQRNGKVSFTLSVLKYWEMVVIE